MISSLFVVTSPTSKLPKTPLFFYFSGSPVLKRRVAQRFSRDDHDIGSPQALSIGGIRNRLSKLNLTGDRRSVSLEWGLVNDQLEQTQKILDVWKKEQVKVNKRKEIIVCGARLFRVCV